MKKRLIQICILALSFLMVGCHKLSVITEIKPNTSGRLQTEVGFSAEERANTEKKEDYSGDFCNIAEAPPNITITEEQRGDETWCITTTPFKNLDKLRELYQQRKGITINRLEVVDGIFYYDVDIDTLSEDSSFSALTEITWSLVMPDTPINHNAEQINGNKLTWLPTPKSGIINLHAESKVPDVGINFPICGTAFITLAILFFQMKQNRK